LPYPSSGYDVTFQWVGTSLSQAAKLLPSTRQQVFWRTKKGEHMKRKVQRQGRILTDQELKGALGGTDSPPPTPNDNGSGQQTDARAVVIEIGYS
jgi:hypothetical protein